MNNSQALELVKSTQYANANGTYFNVHITLCWRFCGILDQQEGFDAFQSFRERLRKWLSYYQQDLFCVWANENSHTNGFHSHLAIHCPEHLIEQLRAIAPDWVPVKHSQAVNIATRWKNANPVNSQKGILQYIMKTIDPTATLTNSETGEIVSTATLLEVEPHKADDNPASNTIDVKRAGASQNIGRSARNRAGFVSSLDCWS
jgi:hypothetical protein